jgi:hypothetical protein
MYINVKSLLKFNRYIFKLKTINKIIIFKWEINQSSYQRKKNPSEVSTQVLTSEQIREQKRGIERACRNIEREKKRLETDEKKMKAEIKKMAQAGQHVSVNLTPESC